MSTLEPHCATCSRRPTWFSACGQQRKEGEGGKGSDAHHQVRSHRHRLGVLFEDEELQEQLLEGVGGLLRKRDLLQLGALKVGCLLAPWALDVQKDRSSAAHKKEKQMMTQKKTE